jgi:outer membrane protein assembly factor BamD
MNNIKFLLIIFISLSLFSCASKKEEVKSAANEYKKAIKILKDKRYIEAAEKLESIYDDYPLSKWSIKAQTIAAYAYYKEERYDDIIRVSETFMQLNPSSKYVPYLQYMKSISYFNMIPNSNRGQNYTKIASYDFRELLARFPYSIYADDAKLKILIIEESLAASQMELGRYQIAKQNYVGALLRFNDVVYRYSSTKQVSEAYFRLYEIYYKLGMLQQSSKIKKIILESYKDSIWVDFI